MYQPLVPCPQCERHIRVTEALCPFCGQSIQQNLRSKIVPSLRGRLPRTALAVFSASMIAVGCSNAVRPGPGDPGYDSGTMESATDSASTTDTSDAVDTAETTVDPFDPCGDSGGSVLLYGAPPMCDANTDPPDDNGGSSADYGSPPPMDAGR